MKSKLTLLMVALLSVCAFATTWKASEETPVAAGSTLIDDELVTAKTVFETTLKSSAKTIAGEEFTHFIQVRVAAAPTADEPNGTDNGGSTPIILTAKKDMTLKVYYRRQSTSQNEDSGVYASNDGKDLKIVNQTDPATALDGVLTIVEETEDFKYGWVTKEYELAEGNTYTLWGRGTTIQFYGMTYEGKEPPAPVVGEAIDLFVDRGEDIGAKLAAAMETNKYPSKITINLLGGKNYQVVTPIQVNCPLEFSVLIEEILDPTHANEYANIDASALTGPMIQISDDIHPSLLKDNGFYDLGDIIIGNLEIKGLSQQLVYGNKVKALYGNLLLYHSIVEVASGNKTVIDFNGGGVVETLAINNSTIYGNPQHTGQLYSSQSGQKATEAGLEKQTISIINSTLYNIAYSKNVNTHRQANQTWLAYELKNSMIIDCGKQGQFVKGLNGGQSGKNPTWMIDGNSFQWTVDGALTDISANEETADEEEPVTNNVEGVAVFANDITTGDFTFDQCPQNEARIGDPRWLVEVKETFEGKYYLYNVGAKKYWGCANDWGTRASLVDHPEYVTLAQISEGIYTLESQVSNGGTSYYFGGDYMDGNPVNLTITKVDDENYTIANDAGELYGYDGSSTILGKNVAAGDNALWKIISEEEMLASLNTATASAPVDATFLIIDAKFGRNNRNVDAWVVSEDCINKNLVGGNSNKHCAESYHSTFTISQTLSNVPNGVYAFEAQGFYRQDGSDNDNLAQFFINDETAVVPLKTGAENSMADACASFENGLYKIEPLYVEVKDGQITVGIKNEMNPNLWVIWDNFVLTYYGADASLDEVKNAAIIAELAELRTKATELQGQPEVAKVNEGLTNALTETAEVSASSPTEEIHAAIDKLKAAIEAAEASISAKNTLAAMKELIDNTNVYTEEAYNEYYGQWVAKYEEGSLTKAEAAGLQNPFVVTGWHSSITVDNFLLSAWDTNPDFVDAPYYINSWSVEGESDGSDFKVPFFEYWTGDANSLGERTLTATIANLPAGVYDVSALVRVRVKNGAEDAPTGITLQANEGEPVPVTNGTQIGTSQYYLDTFTAQGIVGEDGILKIKFNVAADNNISWLSFKNVKYAFNPIGDAIVLNVEDGKDIVAELATAMETNKFPESITINLAAGGNYAATSSIVANCPITINGDEANPATIDATALAAPMLLISNELVDNLLGDNGFYQLGNIAISNVKVKGLAQQLIYGNKVKAQYGTLSLNNSIIEMAGGNKTVFDFNGGGVVETLAINNSTIYGNPQHTGQLYSSQSGQKATEAGLEKQTISITNSTLYNIAYSKNVNTHRQANQTWLAYELKNSMIIDCGKQGQFVKGLNGGQSGKNPTWMIDGNSFQWTVDGALTDISINEETADEEEPVTNNVEGVAVFADDITTGDFTFDQCPQNEARIGDPRWLVDVVVPMGEPLYVFVGLGNDIAADVANAMETNPYPSKVEIYLGGGGDYQWNSPIQLNCPLEFVLEVPTGGKEVGYANIDASALTGPMIQISNDIHSDLLAENGFYQLGDIKIEGIKVKGLPQQLIYGNKVKAQYGTLSLEHSIIEVASGNKTVFDFNGGGVVEKLAIIGSTIYGNPQHTGQLYSSQSGQKATEAGLEKQTISITNSTLYNIAYSKNVNTHRQANQTWLAYELKNSIIIDCGKQGQFVKGLNGGQSGANPTWMIDGNSFQWTVDGVLTDISANEETADEAEPVTNNVEGVVVFDKDITTGDFTLGECPQKTAKIGDPRWLYGPSVGIENVNAGANNDVWYNLQGVRVVSPAKGVYIKNGKKVVVK